MVLTAGWSQTEEAALAFPRYPSSRTLSDILGLLYPLILPGTGQMVPKQAMGREELVTSTRKSAETMRSSIAGQGGETGLLDN